MLKLLIVMVCLFLWDRHAFSDEESEAWEFVEGQTIEISPIPILRLTYLHVDVQALSKLPVMISGFSIDGFNLLPISSRLELYRHPLFTLDQYSRYSLAMLESWGIDTSRLQYGSQYTINQLRQSGIDISKIESSTTIIYRIDDPVLKHAQEWWAKYHNINNELLGDVGSRIMPGINSPLWHLRRGLLLRMEQEGLTDELLVEWRKYAEKVDGAIKRQQKALEVRARAQSR